MKRQEIKIVRDLADEHFDGDIRPAAAAHHLGLGVVKMKMNHPEFWRDQLTPADNAVMKAIFDATNFDETASEEPARKPARKPLKRDPAKPKSKTKAKKKTSPPTKKAVVRKKKSPRRKSR